MTAQQTGEATVDPDRACHKCGRDAQSVSMINDGDDGMGPPVCVDCYDPDWEEPQRPNEETPELPQRQAWRAFVDVFRRCWCGNVVEGTAAWAIEHVRCIPDLPRTEPNEEPELDSPNFVPEELKDLEKRGYERVNAWQRTSEARCICHESPTRHLDCPVHVAMRAAAPADFIDVVFDGPPRHESGRFIEVEDPSGKSVSVGEWISRGNGLWALRIPRPRPEPAVPVDGREAEELRRGIEEIVKTCRPCVSTRGEGCTGCHIVEELELLLDRVDARDSLAYLEQRRESPDTYTRAELNAALEGMRVTVTDAVTDDVIAKVGAWLRSKRDACDEFEHVDGTYATGAREALDEVVGDLHDGEWRRATVSESTEGDAK